jgi:hypothetical protein
MKYFLSNVQTTTQKCYLESHRGHIHHCSQWRRPSSPLHPPPLKAWLGDRKVASLSVAISWPIIRPWWRAHHHDCH